MKRKTKQNLIAIAAALACVLLMVGIGLALIAATTETGNTKNQSTNTESTLSVMNLEGVWTYKSDKGGVFEATVTDKSIKILMKTPDDTSLVYWNGTFDSNQTVGATVISKVGEDAFILSKAESKEFVVGIDTLTFDFTQAGKTKKVELRRA